MKSLKIFKKMLRFLINISMENWIFRQMFSWIFRQLIKVCLKPSTNKIASEFKIIFSQTSYENLLKLAFSANTITKFSPNPQIYLTRKYSNFIRIFEKIRKFSENFRLSFCEKFWNPRHWREGITCRTHHSATPLASSLVSPRFPENFLLALLGLSFDR